MNDTPSPAGGAEATGQGATAQGATAQGRSAGEYRVLARKYRPETFDDLIGQEPMVRTIRNGFESGRIAQAWMLTGVRGVGKTTTARILARALNYEIPGEVEKPSVDMPRLGTHCAAIMASRHVDVIEMDAASHTGIGDIREITDASRYMPASARYKVYIIDEVHMLSKQAFNGLLKTLEEPPAHVKFIFATTEIRKVPVTILSRCQRFDLRRIERDVLIENLAHIAEMEGVAAERAALGLIAQAAEGSVRDAQSLLDQAIAHGAGTVRTDEVSAMLGLADRARIVDLFEATMAGRVADALGILDALYGDGADPVVVLGDLAALSHQLTQLRIVPGSLDDAGFDSDLKARLEKMAEKLAIPHLSRAWQILLKGIAEVETAPRPIAAADMVLVRLAYAADLPAPDAVIRQLKDDRPAAAPPTQSVPARDTAPAPTAQRIQPVMPPPAGPAVTLPQPDSFEAMVALVREKRDMVLLTWLERSVRLVAFEPGKVTLAIEEGAQKGLVNTLSQRLREWTGRNWVFPLDAASSAPTIHERREAERDRRIADARATPEIAAVLERFPGAEIVDVELLDETPQTDVSADDDADTRPDETTMSGGDRRPRSDRS